MMQPEILNILKESTKLARDVQPLIEKHAACKSRASKVSDILVANNVIPIEKRAELEENLKDPEFAYDLIVKLASQVTVDSLGEMSGETTFGGETAEEKFLNWITS